MSFIVTDPPTNTVCTSDVETCNMVLTCDMITQRNRYISLLGPPPRLTPISPYPNYTQSQLDMRRKAEILKYKQTSTMSNTLTKAQKFAQAMKGTFKNTTYTDNNGNLVVGVLNAACQTDQYLPTSSSSCDVPGPPVTLQLNPAIPLYNYATNTDAYANLPTPTLKTFQSFTSNNIVSMGVIPLTDGNSININQTYYFNTDSSVFDTLAITNPTSSVMKFSINIPIAIFISGQVASSGGISQDISGNVSIDKLHFSIYNNKNVVSINPTYTFNGQQNTNNKNLSIYFSTNTSGTNGTFNGLIYVGNLQINNINLLTQIGFVYDFNIYAKMNTIIYSNTDVLPVNLNMGIQTNIVSSSTISNHLSPFRFTNGSYNPIPYFSPFSISGI